MTAPKDGDNSAQIVAKFLAVVHQMNPAEPLSLAEIAAELAWSQKSLQRHCQAVYGINPKALMTRVLMLRARVMLCREGLTSVAVARRFGYQPACNFARVYRRVFGCSPSESHFRAQQKLPIPHESDTGMDQKETA